MKAIKAFIFIFSALIGLPHAVFANPDAEFNWENLIRYNYIHGECINLYSETGVIPQSDECSKFDPSASYYLDLPLSTDYKVKLDSEGNLFIAGRPLRLIQSRVPEKWFIEVSPRDHSKIILSPTQGKAGAFFRITYAFHFEVIDEDDPLCDPFSTEPPVAVVLEAIRFRSPSSLDAMLTGKVSADWYSGASKNYLAATKAERISKASLEESKVKLFGVKIYGARQSEINLAMKRSGLIRVGSVPGKVSDVFDSSGKVAGSSRLEFRYDGGGHLGKATYVFPSTHAHEIIQRVSNVYGEPDGKGIWTVGRIKIRVSDNFSNKGAELDYIVMPYYKHLEDDKTADINAF